MKDLFGARLRSRKGFTLMEFFVAMAILAILASFAVPRYAKVIERAKSAECLVTRANAQRAEEIYMGQNEGRAASTLELVEKGYLDRMPRCVAGGSLVWLSTAPLKLACSLHDASPVPVAAAVPAGSSAGSTAAGSGGGSAAPETYFSSNLSSMDGIDPLTGAWRLSGGLLTITSKGKSVNEAIVSTGPFTDYTTDLTATITSGGFGVMYRASIDSGNRVSGYSFQLDATGKLELWTIVGSKPAERLASSAMPSGFPVVGVQHTVSVDVTGTRSTFYVDGVQVMQVTDAAFSSGTSGIRQWGGTSSFDTIVLAQG